VAAVSVFASLGLSAVAELFPSPPSAPAGHGTSPLGEGRKKEPHPEGLRSNRLEGRGVLHFA